MLTDLHGLEIVLKNKERVEQDECWKKDCKGGIESVSNKRTTPPSYILAVTTGTDHFPVNLHGVFQNVMKCSFVPLELKVVKCDECVQSHQ